MSGAAVAVRDRFVALVHELQEDYCRRLEAVDGGARFGRDAWRRPGGGGGVTRALGGGATLEKAGVNVSVVHGRLDEALAARLGGSGETFFAAGISLIVHPRSPMVPTAHLNLRYLEQGRDSWFGGGADLTPCYLYEDDARHFHRELRRACYRHPVASYAALKDECDRYFRLPHRDEARGVGGIFFDHQRGDPAALLDFVAAVGDAFPAAYLPIVERRRHEPWGEREARWQALRRGRYVEFNLVWDRGTRFGLETSGRTESILVSMPPRAEWAYDHRPEPGSREAALVEVLRRPRAWLDEA